MRKESPILGVCKKMQILGGTKPKEGHRIFRVSWQRDVMSLRIRISVFVFFFFTRSYNSDENFYHLVPAFYDSVLKCSDLVILSL